MKLEKPKCYVQKIKSAMIGDFNPADVCVVIAAIITAGAIIIAD